MIYVGSGAALETKFCRFETDVNVSDEAEISGYASVFGASDQGNDVVQKGAYAASLKAIQNSGRRVKMLWQHDPSKPIGVWDDVREDEKGLFVKGRILADVQAGAEALSLIKAGAIEGLSIGYRTIRAEKSQKGKRLLHELDLWEVSLVTFPMLPEARVETDAKADDQLAHELVAMLNAARHEMLA
ncbi:HK97 family phage prohead protease [Amylibacter sp. IMCC11727]|uniref:HK97 family phage prohead protease n=1 Tax=Amylibacter sp. IMCC11727 TaxID=3039851 RepID=UPI00244DA7FC|nr:HK97 family phage prohead protease [Amylibacter sp. IMCC11727]WGI20840.1 HK97 family phage prohead protease [Amylibacter sp. IMCC11727]